jgi:predicted nucleic acid-binding protein
VTLVLVDTGPLVALIDRGDRAHGRCVAAAKALRRGLTTTWPVITEALYMLADGPAGQNALLAEIEAGDLLVADLRADDVPSMRALMEKYADLPMDFADASLVAVAQREGLETVFTLDRHFRLYRRDGRQSFKVVPHLT